jgi:hypothetical protein
MKGIIMNKTLIRSVKRSLDMDSIKDICNHGISGGYGNFIYYSDTAKWYKSHKKAVNALVEEFADDLGMDPLKMVQNFNCIKGDKETQFSLSEIAKTMYGRRSLKEQNDLCQIDNALCWFAVEEICRYIVDVENNNNDEND